MIVTMSNVWDRTTEFLSDNLAGVMPIALGAILVPNAISAIVAPFARQSPTANVTVALIALVLTLVTLWGQLAIIALAIDLPAGRQAAVRLASARILPMIGISLLAMIATILLLLPYPVILGLAGYDLTAAMNGAQPDVPPGVGGILAIYTLILLPLIAFLGARLVLLSAVVVRERRGIGAFEGSFVLTRGIAWKVIGVLLLYLVVFGVAVLAARTVFGSILRLIAGGDGIVTVASVLTAILVAAVQAVFVTLASAFVGKLYVAMQHARGAIVDPA